MYMQPFLVEDWIAKYKSSAKYNLGESTVNSVSLYDLFDLTGADKNAFLQELCSRRLTYGTMEGYSAFLEGICRLYRTIRPQNIIPTHGASGASHQIFYSLLRAGDHIISIVPTYQQLYSIPESYGAKVQLLRLKPETGFLPDLRELQRLAVPGTKMICITNPNNPAGTLLSKEMLQKIAEIARHANAYVLCDEVYRHLTQQDVWSDSIADLYEKGISIGSMSKAFSMAGLRLGWIASRDQEVIRTCLSRRDYNSISCGMCDENIAALALAHSEKLLARSRSIVRENLQILDAWLQQEPHLRYFRPQAGTTALVYYDFPVSSHEFCKQLYQETGAFVIPGDCFGQPNCMRIGYGCDQEILVKGLAAVSCFLRQLETRT